MSILFSKEVSETLLLFANLRVEVRELEGIWRLDYLFRELPVCCESQPSLQRGRYLCVVWCSKQNDGGRGEEELKNWGVRGPIMKNSSLIVRNMECGHPGLT